MTGCIDSSLAASVTALMLILFTNIALGKAGTDTISHTTDCLQSPATKS